MVNGRLASLPGRWFQVGEPGLGSLRWSDHPANELHQNWMRNYEPTTGRYLQADPLGLVDGASVLGYALHNPGRWVDPRGRPRFLLSSAGSFLLVRSQEEWARI